uniref:UPAR/Ly6 domain-containing protein n=1 Tax=Monodon monoceros TaxID=40151 RepID=A0A8C6BUZ1_MONMO
PLACLTLFLLIFSLSSRPLSFHLSFLESFQCRVNTSGVCETGESFCQTPGRQQRFLRKVYEGDTISYGCQGCSSLCVPMKLFNLNVTVNFRCCRDSPLCNKF